MGFGARIKRIADLFAEGETVYFGDDDEGKPILVWVNKLNSFEMEDARRDGIVRRSQRMAALGKDDNPERMGLLAEMKLWDDETLAKNLVSGKADQIYLDTLNDLQADPEWRELSERVQRLPELLDQSGVPDEDPQREALAADQRQWLTTIDQRHRKALEDARHDAEASGRESMEDALIEQWRDRQTLDDFMEERRTTQLWIAMRDCTATDVSTGGQPQWDHAGCDHTQKLVGRDEIRTLPEEIISKCIDALDGMTVPAREAGNSDAPASSSASLEPTSAPEAESTPSTPTGTLSEPPTS